MVKRMFLLFVLAAAFAWAGSASATLRSGIFGTVTKGPITPVCAAEQPCSGPAAGAVLVFLRGSQEVARVTVGSTGAYRIHLPPGSYVVRTRSLRTQSVAVRVSSGHMTRADLSIDTGIR